MTTNPDEVDEPINMDVDTPAETDHFEDLTEHDSIPSVPLSSVQRIRFSALAQDLEDAEIQAYIEANFGIQVLEALKMVIPIFAGLV